MLLPQDVQELYISDTLKRHRHTMVAEPIRIGDIGSTAQAHRVYSSFGKSVTINAGEEVKVAKQDSI